MKAVYVPLARKTFYLPSAKKCFAQSCTALRAIFPHLVAPEHLLYEPEEVSHYLEDIDTPDLVIYQCVTFIGADFMYEVLRRFNCPLVIWAVREPSMDGGRLQLNSLTGAFSAGNAVHIQGKAYSFIFGNANEETVLYRFRALASALSLKEHLSKLTIGIIGEQPPGFDFGAVDASELLGQFGIRLHHIEATEIMEKARGYTIDELQAEKRELTRKTIGSEDVPQENLEKYLRLRRAFNDYVQSVKVGAIASQCWPDFFTKFGAPVCTVLSMLNDAGIPASCETDVGGAITMYMARQLTGSAVFFGDPVAIDEANNAVVYWHCGAGAPSLARDEKAHLGVHPNRKIGPTMKFGLKKGTVTILRLGHEVTGYRLYVMRGEALDVPRKFLGTSVTVRPINGKVTAKIANAVEDGWEPHYIIAYGDIQEALAYWCKFSHVPLVEY